MAAHFRDRSRFIGGALVLIGLGANKWVLESTLAPDGWISSPFFVTFIVAFQVGAVATGVLVLRRRACIRFRGSARWALLLLSTAVSVAFVELLLHFQPAFQPRPRAFAGEHQNRPSLNFVADQSTGWRMRPRHEFKWIIAGSWDTYRSNAQGFRGQADFTLRTQKQKIVLVGDSFTFGTGVEYAETYGALIEAQLHSSVIYNLAMPGFGIDQMWMSVRHQALPMRPSLVIVGFVDDNFDRSLTAYRSGEGFTKPTFTLEDGGLRPQTPDDRPAPLVRFLERHSALWTAGRVISRRFAYKMAFGQWWSQNAAILREMQKECRESGVPVLFVRLPQREWRRFPTLQSYMMRIGASYLDLSATDSAPPPGLHFARDSHINAEGHRHVAKAILEWIRVPLSARSNLHSP